MQEAMNKKSISKIINRILPKIIELRHAIHRDPELAGNEFNTAKLIRQTLAYTDIDLLAPYLETDVIGVLENGKNGKCVGLRADIDALPIQETTDIPYKSCNNGVMHACGHDGHTAILLGTAIVLNEIKDQLKGSVKFIFQPGEEVAALGKELVKAGALESPKPDAVFALHCFPGFPVGTVRSRAGTVMAAAGFFKIKIIGKGGHCSKPETCIDPIVTACQVVNHLQTIVSRRLGPQYAACLSICRFSGGQNSNVIPETVILEGSTRFLDNTVGNQFPELIENAVQGICSSNGAKYEFEYTLPYIPTINDIKYLKMAKSVTIEHLGHDKWIKAEKASMGGEDFSYFLEKCPGVYCNIGMGEDHIALHNPQFDFEDKALHNAIMFMVMMTLEAMGI